MTHPSLSSRSLISLVDALRAGVTSARELVDEAIDSHNTFGRSLGAYRVFDEGAARAQAEQADARLASGEGGLLCGLPISVKDLYGVDGFDTWAGTPKQLPKRWESEGWLVGRLRAHGAVIVGKTHTVEMAFGGVGTNPHHGTPVNPWDAGQHRVPGGSSCGAGVSLQEGSAVIALGTDTGGSIRIPASATGVVGQKLTVDRWETTGVVPLSTTLDTVGGLARSVEDIAAFFCGIETSTEDEARARLAEAQAHSLADLTIGIPDGDHWQGCQTDIARGLESALHELERAGATLVPLPGVILDRAVAQQMDSGIAAVECREFLQAELSGWINHLDHTVSSRLEGTANLSALDYVRTLRLRRVAQSEFLEQISGVDVIALPTLPLTPPTVEEVAKRDAYGPINRRMLSATCPINWLGACAITLPVGLDRTGMPMGLQFAGAPGSDESLLGWALAAERTLGTSANRIGSPPRIQQGAAAPGEQEATRP